MLLKKVLIFWVMAVLVMAVNTAPANADNVIELLKAAEKNYTAKQYGKALDDLEWIRNEIAGLHIEEMKKLLPDELEGMTGKDIEGGATFGLHSVSKNFDGDDRGQSVKITLSSSKSGQGGANLGAIMGMAAAYGGKQSKMVIQQGYRGQFSIERETRGRLLFTLDGGGMVTIETNGWTDESMAKKAAEKLDLTRIDAVLR